MTENKFFVLLRADHEKVKGILASLDETKASAAKTREKLFLKLRQELVPHMKAEETTFYPPLLAKKESRKDALEGAEEHHVSEMVLKELETMPQGEDQWTAKMAVFKELVEHHIEEEQTRIFKSSEKALDDAEFQTIMTKFNQEKQRVLATLK